MFKFLKCLYKIFCFNNEECTEHKKTEYNTFNRYLPEGNRYIKDNQL